MASRRIRRTSSFTGFLAATSQDINTAIKRNDVTSISAGVIDGSHIAEEIQVIDKALQSDNYVPAEAGWKIDGSGNAEFANVYVRGDINAQTGTIGYWNISTPSVTRTFGTNTLFGTFLESQNLGSSDVGASGTYVSLFKSYTQPDSGLTAIARDADGNAVVTVVGHNYLVGDLVTVTVDSVSGFSTGSTPVSILSVTTDTFTYANPGSVVSTTDTTGTVTFVNPDVSGLYLKDYTKANFDYGFMSNTGMSYVSAETLNLIYNPSFEYIDTTTSTLTPSVASWTTSTGGTPIQWSFISSTLKDYATASSYGGAVGWTRVAPTAKLQTTVGYNIGDTYKLFSGDRPLYFNYDVFLNYTPFISTPSSVSATSTTVTITTSGAHGLLAGDLVYLDFTAKDLAFISPATYTPDVDFALDYTNNSKIFEVKTVTSATVFTVDNRTGYGAPVSGPVLAYRTNRDGTTRSTRYVYKVVWPAVDLSEVAFLFPNGSTTTLYSVLDSATKASWDASAYYKYKTLNPNLWMLEYLDVVDGISPIVGNEIVIDGSALRDAYKANDSSGFFNKTDIKIQLPIKMYSQTTTNGYAGTPTSTTAAVVGSRCAVTSISYGGGYITYTGPHNYTTDDYVTVTGATHAPYNITDVKIYSVSPTGFTVQVSVTAGSSSSATATAYKSVYSVFDEVSFSTEPVAFFGDTSSSYYWKDDTLNSPSQVSVQAPKKWIDIDLSTQTGTIANMDYVGFKSSHLSHPLVSKPSISTIYTADSSLFDLYGIVDYEQISMSSGIFSKPNSTDTAFIDFEAYSRSITSDTAALSEISSYAYNQKSSVTTFSEYSNTRVVLSADAIHMDGNLRVSNIYPSLYGEYMDAPDSTKGTIYIYGEYLLIQPTNRTSFKSVIEAEKGVWATASDGSYDSTTVGAWLSESGYGAFVRDNGTPLIVGRLNAGTQLAAFAFDGTTQGSITVSGATVSYNNFLGSHYSETTDTDILVGTVMETIDDLVEGNYHLQERLPKTKVSTTIGSTRVYGVYFSEESNDDGDNTGHFIASVGASKIRIASGIEVSGGDLLESNGDGCARVQSDNIIKSSTIGKVTSAKIVKTYDDGSYLVPCVLYCG